MEAPLPVGIDANRVRRAVVLAAGRGTRLGHHTAACPKPLLDVAGRPLLEWILLGLRGAGVAEAIIVIGYLGEQIRERFADGAPLGLRLAYAVQEKPNGTGAAFLLGREFAGTEPVFMSFGDILTDFGHYAAVADDYAASPCAAVMGINPMEDVRAGASVVREGRRVIGIVEKPDRRDPLRGWNQAGVSIFGPQIWPFLANHGPSARGEIELTEGLAAMIAQGETVRAVEFNGYWSDIGTPDALDEARVRWGSDCAIKEDVG